MSELSEFLTAYLHKGTVKTIVFHKMHPIKFK